jgi:hypothetical protein
MKWAKLGLAFNPAGCIPWAAHTALTPTPHLLDEATIRVFAGFRDSQGISRIGFVDVDATDPLRVIRYSRMPALDIGEPGSFDDNGVILGDVIPHDGMLYMYYVGFQLVAKVKFLAFTGLASSSDGGEHFERLSTAPVLDRADHERCIRAVHSVLVERGRFRIWYASGDGWELIGGAPYPRYNIRYLEASAPDDLRGRGRVCADVCGNEYRIGRPRVYRINGRYLMLYTRGTRTGDYLAGCAESDDGNTWTRKDELIGIGLSPSGWDSKHLCYPALIESRGRFFVFYNGNDMGKDGIGCAELMSW